MSRATGSGLLAVPVLPWMWTECAIAFVDLVRALPPGWGHVFETNVSSIAAKRNLLVEALLQSPSSVEWVLFVDSDMVPPRDLPQRLMRSARSFDIVAALYFKRRPPHGIVLAPLPGREFHPDYGLQEVSWVGFGAVLVPRRVFLTMPFPWFEHPAPGTGEDLYFCEKARKLGFRIAVDPSIDVPHMDAVGIDRARAEGWWTSPKGQAQMRASLANGSTGDPALRHVGAALDRLRTPSEPGANA